MSAILSLLFVLILSTSLLPESLVEAGVVVAVVVTVAVRSIDRAGYFQYAWCAFLHHPALSLQLTVSTTMKRKLLLLLLLLPVMTYIPGSSIVVVFIFVVVVVVEAGSLRRIDSPMLVRTHFQSSHHHQHQHHHRLGLYLPLLPHWERALVRSPASSSSTSSLLLLLLLFQVSSCNITRHWTDVPWLKPKAEKVD